MAEGAVSRGGAALTDASAQGARRPLPDRGPAACAGRSPSPRRSRSTVLFEDAHLIVVDKPAGMAAHPAPGSETGTLVNALLAHCGASLSGIGGVARPGIVHRLDKDTSGVMVAAKTDAAHRGLAALFERHDIERGLPRLHPRRAAPANGDGRHAARPLAARPQEDGGAAQRRPRGGDPLRAAARLSDPPPGRSPPASPAGWRPAAPTRSASTSPTSARPASAIRSTAPAPRRPAVKAAIAAAGLTRQALHAAVLGFVHPITGERAALRDASCRRTWPGCRRTLEGL